MGFAPEAHIDHGAFRHNLAVARKAARGAKIWAVVKADAYGHGILAAAASLGDADGFAVARVDEGIRLREAAVKHPILVLEGAFSRSEIEAASHSHFDIVLHHHAQLELLRQSTLSEPVRVWVKIDTGMHRLGFLPEQIPEVREKLSSCANLESPIRWITHLANADDLGDPFTRTQIGRLQGIVGRRDEVSIANSAGLLGWPESHGSWVGPGIMLYGSSPFVGESGSERGLRQVMTLEARLLATKLLRSGEPIGYGGTYVCPDETLIGVVGAGYGDGYPRHASSGTPVVIGGSRVPLVGRVSMDMLTVDLGKSSNARIGDPVTLWGEGLPAEEVAARAGTISYELFCGITARVDVIHHNQTWDADGTPRVRRWKLG